MTSRQRARNGPLLTAPTLGHRPAAPLGRSSWKAEEGPRLPSVGKRAGGMQGSAEGRLPTLLSSLQASPNPLL